jgi:hypothetical protein
VGPEAGSKTTKLFLAHSSEPTVQPQQLLTSGKRRKKKGKSIRHERNVYIAFEVPTKSAWSTMREMYLFLSLLATGDRRWRLASVSSFKLQIVSLGFEEDS